MPDPNFTPPQEPHNQPPVDPVSNSVSQTSQPQRPVQPQVPPVQQSPEQPVTTQPYSGGSSSKFNIKLIGITASFIVGLALLGIGGWYGYTRVSNNEDFGEVKTSVSSGDELSVEKYTVQVGDHKEGISLRTSILIKNINQNKMLYLREINLEISSKNGERLAKITNFEPGRGEVVSGSKIIREDIILSTSESDSDYQEYIFNSTSKEDYRDASVEISLKYQDSPPANTYASAGLYNNKCPDGAFEFLVDQENFITTVKRSNTSISEISFLAVPYFSRDEVVSRDKEDVFLFQESGNVLEASGYTKLNGSLNVTFGRKSARVQNDLGYETHPDINTAVLDSITLIDGYQEEIEHICHYAGN